MHKLIGAACRRTAGMTAGVILAAGVAGGVLLTPGTAYADSGTTVVITTATPTSTWNGATLNVQVSVTVSTGSPSGMVAVSDGSGGCNFTLPSGGTSTTAGGSCNITGLSDGIYTLTATYGGSSSDPYSVTIGSAPTFDAAWPPLTATAGQGYSSTFRARGSPAPSYTLSGPSWLYIDSSNGTVSGTVPYGISSFTYWVKASNGIGQPASVGPFTVQVKQGYIDIRTYLSCPSYVFTGQQGRCTLWVSNFGSARAPNVFAQIALPSQLRADYCGYYYYYSSCSISNNTAYQTLGALYPGQTRAVTVVFTAKTGYGLWGRHRGHQFTVSVFGYAASNGYGPFSGRRQSFSIAYVTIVPHGHWW